MGMELQRAERADLQEAPRAGELIGVLSAAIVDPRVDVEKLERILGVHERLLADQRRTAYIAAMARLAPKLPEIGKHGQSHHGKYSRLVDIDRVLRPLLGEEGLSLSFDSEEIATQGQKSRVKVTCRCAHEQGHSETKSITLDIDNSGSKNPAQAVISTVSYGRRALTVMFFNLVSEEEDTDGNAHPKLLTPDQIDELQRDIDRVGADKARFLKFMGVNALADISQRDFTKAKNALNEKGKSR